MLTEVIIACCHGGHALFVCSNSGTQTVNVGDYMIINPFPMLHMLQTSSRIGHYWPAAPVARLKNTYQ